MIRAMRVRMISMGFKIPRGKARNPGILWNPIESNRIEWIPSASTGFQDSVLFPKAVLGNPRESLEF